MDRLMTNTATAKQEMLKFWSDGQPHSVEQFRSYVKKNGLLELRGTHLGSAVQSALQQGVLERITRGMYIAGPNFSEDQIVGDIGAKESVVKGILKSTMRIFSQPINVMELSQREREILPKLQDLYVNCSQWLDELNREDEHGVSQ